MIGGTNVTANGGQPFYFVGNLLCLDFVNTEIGARGEPVDLLSGFADLVQWLQAAAVLTATDARSIEKRWGDVSEGNAAFKEAVLLRGALRVMAERLVAGKSVDRNSIEQIN